MYRTELMDKILHSKRANEIIQRLTPIYGEAYVMLWLLEVSGQVLDKAHEYAEEFRAQILPNTATSALHLWEQQYGIATNDTLSDEERQNNIIRQLLIRSAINPYRLAKAISDMTGFEVEIRENLDNNKNKFGINIFGHVADTSHIREFVDKVKPAHLTYIITMSELFTSEVPMYSSVVSYLNNEKLGNVEVIN